MLIPLKGMKFWSQEGGTDHFKTSEMFSTKKLQESGRRRCFLLKESEDYSTG